jgi:AraC-like DNA-binding protein
MRGTDFLPSEPLRPFVKGYKIIEVEEERVNRLLPGTALALAFRFQGETNQWTNDATYRLPSATVSGMRKSVRLIQYHDHSSTLVVMFREGGVASFFKQPVHEFFEESLSLEDWISRGEVARVEEALAGARTHLQRIACIEKFLLDRFVPRQDALVQAALQAIYRTKGTLRVHDLTDSLSLSTDAFEKRFRKIIGTSPKQFATIVRLQSIVRQRRPDQSMAQLALDAGYFDQSHFNKEFKLFTGLSPVDFFRSPVFW